MREGKMKNIDQLMRLDAVGEIPIGVEQTETGALRLTIDFSKYKDSSTAEGQPLENGAFRREIIRAKLLTDLKVNEKTDLKNHYDLETGLCIVELDPDDTIDIRYQHADGESALLWSMDVAQWQQKDEANPGIKAYPMTATEMRQMAYYNSQALDIPSLERTEIDMIRDAELMPKTDLHTHLSAQIKPKDLLRLAAEVDDKAVAPNGEYDQKKGVLYPVALLKKLVERGGKSKEEADAEVEERLQNITRYKAPPATFIPRQSEGLDCEQDPQSWIQDPQTGKKRSQLNECEVIRVSDIPDEYREKLEATLAIPQHDIYDAGNFDSNMYRYGNFLTKSPNLIAPIIDQVAKDYAAQGITYTEQAVTSAAKPEWLERALPALEKAHKDHGVTMRLLIAIQREQDPRKTLGAIESVQSAARSPYIAGVDFLGYEINRTKNFVWALNLVARWAKDHDPDFIIRVHAGENTKNESNVIEAMRVADHYGIRMRIGHGLRFGQNMSGDVTDEFRTLAASLVEKGLLAVEFNPDSNIALNNIDTLDKIPFGIWRGLNVPCVIASDGAGMYHTDVDQIVTGMLSAGMTQENFAAIRQYEDAHIEHQKEVFEKKQAQLPESVSKEQKTFPEWLATQLTDGIRETSFGSSSLEGAPILIVGASGASWQKMKRDHPEAADKVRLTIGMLAKAIDKNKAYFMGGRSKDSGVTHVLDQALGAMGIEEAPHFLAVLSTDGSPQLPTHMDKIDFESCRLAEVPDLMMRRVKKHNGMAISFHGGDFTRGFNLHAEKLGVSHALMTGIGGASYEKSIVAMTKAIFEKLGIATPSSRHPITEDDPLEMVCKLQQSDKLKDAFKEQYRSREALEELRDEVLRDIEKEKKSEAGQIVEAPRPIVAEADSLSVIDAAQRER